MIAVDTSVVVAGFASWHELHGSARRVLDEGPRLPAHCAVEVYSVLTRLPPPHRVEAALVHELLAARFPQPFLTLDARRHRALLARLAELGIAGGAAYDALVATTVAAAGAELASCDRRARRTYEQCGARVRTVG